MTTSPWTAGAVSASQPSSTRSASPPPTGATAAASEASAPRKHGAPGHIRNLVVNPVYRGVLQYGRRSQAQRPRGHLRSRRSARLGGRLERRYRHPQAQPRLAPTTPAIPTSSAPSSAAPSAASPSAVPGPGGLATAATAPWPTAAPSLASASAPPSRASFLKPQSGPMSPASSTDPDELIDELLAESNDAETRAVAEAERVSLIAARDAAQDRRKRAIDLYTRAKLSEVEFDAIAADVERELKTLDERLADLEPENDALTTPSPRMCSRRSVNGSTADLSGRAPGDRSAARAPDHRPHHPPRARPQAGPRRYRLPLPAGRCGSGTVTGSMSHP